MKFTLSWLKSHLDTTASLDEMDISASYPLVADAMRYPDDFAWAEYRIDPAAPADLATAARKYANTLLDIGAAATAGSQTDDPQQKVRLDDAGADSKQISDICK